MTTSATVLDLIGAFRRSKTMFAAVEPGIFEGKRPAGYKELAHLLEKQQEYLNAPEPCSRNRDRHTSGAVLDLIEASRRSKTMLAAAEPGIFDGKHPADYKEPTRLLKKQQREYVNTPASGTPAEDPCSGNSDPRNREGQARQHKALRQAPGAKRI